MENRKARVQRYKHNRIKGMSPYNAARSAGYSKSTASQANRIEARVKDELKDAFEQAGLTDKQIIEHAIAGLNAMDGDKPNWTIRHKYLNTILEITERINHQINIDNSKHLNNVYLSTKLKEARERVSATTEQPRCRTDAGDGKDEQRPAALGDVLISLGSAG